MRLLRSDITRTIFALGRAEVLLLSIRAWRFVPEPEIKTVILLALFSELSFVSAMIGRSVVVFLYASVEVQESEMVPVAYANVCEVEPYR